MAFLPRAVRARQRKLDVPALCSPQESASPAPSSSTLAPTESSANDPQSKPSRTAGSASSTASEDDDAAAAYLSTLLSDWSLHMNSSLREALRSSREFGTEGFIPLSDVLDTSLELSIKQLPPVRTSSLLKRAGTEISTRMALTEPKTSISTRAFGPTGFEVSRPESEIIFDEQYWTDRTLYIEEIPHFARTRTGIVKLLRNIQALLLAPGSIQGVHSLDEMFDSASNPSSRKSLGDLTRAFVVFKDVDVMESVLRDLPWTVGERRETIKKRQVEGVWGDLETCQTRAISRNRFDELQAQYQAHQQYLRHQNSLVNHSRMPLPPQSQTNDLRPSALSSQDHSRSPDYPNACVLFVRNVEVDTNKTALKAVFNGILEQEGAISYVDWEKGMDTAHLRVTKPEMATRIIESSAKNSPSAMQVEIVQGRPEEIYWNNLPPQIRQRALQISRGDMNGTNDYDGQDQGRKRRRRLRE